MINEEASAQTPEGEYQITTRQNKIKRNQVTALHLMIGFLLFMMGLVTWLVPAAIKTDRFAFLNIVGIFYCIFGLFLILISVFFNKKIIQNSFKNRLLRVAEIVVLVSILAYAVIQKWYLPLGYSTAALLVIIFAFLWERNAEKAQVIQINETGIFVPGFFKNNSLKWQEITRVVLRHAVLTIDCTNNHLFQFDVSNVTPDDGSPHPFHRFCEAMIEKHKELREEDW